MRGKPEACLLKIRAATEKLAARIGVRGLMNVQYAIKDDILYVIEANPRASRTVPFVSKATAVQLAKAAARIAVGETIAELRNAGVLPASVWGDLWRLWPLVLVLAGLELLVGRRLPWLFAIGGLAIVVLALGVAASSYGVLGAARANVATETVPTARETRVAPALQVVEPEPPAEEAIEDAAEGASF